MPSPTLIRNFRPKSYYHVYNRGAFKHEVFLESADYWVFRRIFRALLKQSSGGVISKTFCLIPNHFHFQFYQREELGISKLMHSAMIRYGLYLRKKYEHSGRVFQGPYQMIYLATSKDRMRIHRYILENPAMAGLPADWPHVGIEP